MKDLFYRQDGSSRPNRPVALPVSRTAQLLRPEDYLPDPGLTDAVNVALLLGQPLFLTGEPGCGKTQLAYNLAWQLGFSEPLKFETKSDSSARDLFYVYDALGRFQAAHSGVDGSALSYMKYNALGLAILRANEPSAVADVLPPDFEHGGKQRSVVLIDEIDKAPRDFPNDLLNELDGMYFRIPELGNAKVTAETEMRPVVVLTSNSEKDLPDAFLRRCVFYNIPFPDHERLTRIVEARLGTQGGAGSELLAAALEVFSQLRDRASGLRKKPSTAELLGWLVALKRLGGEAANPLAEQPDLARRTLNSLIKTTEDHTKAARIVERWIEQKQQ